MLSAPGTLHHVMVRGIEKRNIVNDKIDREDFLRRMGEFAKGTDTAIYAWTLMSKLAYILWRVGVSTSAISKILRRGNK